MKQNSLIYGIVAAMLWCVGGAPAEYSHSSTVWDGVGGASAAGALTNISAAAQPGGVTVSLGGNYINYAGFLNTFLLDPTADADDDGVADENAFDNDGDGLDDAVELAGSAFDPVTRTGVNNPDPDDDGVIDGDEAMAGTDPQDGAANLRVIDWAPAGPGVRVSWLGREGRTYVLRYGNDLVSGATVPAYTNTAVGGAGRWMVVTNFYTGPRGHDPDKGYFTVEVLP